MATVHKNFYSNNGGSQSLFSGDPVEIDASFKQLGSIGYVRGAESVFLWVNYDSNTSTDMQIKVLGGYSLSDISYSFPIESVSASKVDNAEEVREFPDSDTKMVFQVNLEKGVPYIRFYVKDAADGTGQIDSAYVTFA